MKNLIQTILVITLLFGGAAWAGKVDINKAGAAALMENLDGVGPVKAKAILDYRKKNGSFKTYDDLMSVPGIGEETIKKNKANLSLKGGITKSSGATAAKKTAEKAATKSADKKVKAGKEKSEKAKKPVKDKTKAKANKAKKDTKKAKKSTEKKVKTKAKDKVKKEAKKATK